MTSDIIKVVLADDHTVVRAGLKAVLSTALVTEARKRPTSALWSGFLLSYFEL